MRQPQLRMHQNIGGYTFEGPYMTTEFLPEKPGLYAAVCSDQRNYYLLGVGYSLNISRAVKSGARRDCWNRNKRGVLMYAFMVEEQLNEEQYKAVAAEVRRRYPRIPCK